MHLEDFIVLRVPIIGDVFDDQLPPLPIGQHASMVFNRFTAFASHANGALAKGYRVGGVNPVHKRATYCDIAVLRDMACDHHDWMAPFQEMGAKMYDLSMGPVALLLAPTMSYHERLWDDHETYECIP